MRVNITGISMQNITCWYRFKLHEFQPLLEPVLDKPKTKSMIYLSFINPMIGFFHELSDGHWGWASLLLLYLIKFLESSLFTLCIQGALVNSRLWDRRQWSFFPSCFPVYQEWLMKEIVLCRSFCCSIVCG